VKIKFEEYLKESNDEVLNKLMKSVTKFIYDYYDTNKNEDIDIALQSINSDNECVIDCQIYCSMDYGSNPDGSFLNVKFLQQCAKEIEKSFHVKCVIDYKFDKLTDTDPPEAEYGVSFTLKVPNDIITIYDFNLTEARVLDDFDKFCDFIKRSDSTAEKSR
jgi:hypothetical protein